MSHITNNVFASKIAESAPDWREGIKVLNTYKVKRGCQICGGYPAGTDCSHQCPNSVHYYSPEQERYDDMWNDGSDDIRERYAGELIGLEVEPWDDDDSDPLWEASTDTVWSADHGDDSIPF